MESDNKIIRASRELRRNQTDAEKKLWGYLRNRKLDGKKFLRQHPFVIKIDSNTEFYVVDFYCAEKKLIIELDGGIHEFQKEYDTDREFILKELGNTILRFKNEELENIQGVLDSIREYFDSPQPLSTS